MLGTGHCFRWCPWGWAMSGFPLSTSVSELVRWSANKACCQWCACITKKTDSDFVPFKRNVDFIYTNASFLPLDILEWKCIVVVNAIYPSVRLSICLSCNAYILQIKNYFDGLLVLLMAGLWQFCTYFPHFRASKTLMLQAISWNWADS